MQKLLTIKIDLWKRKQAVEEHLSEYFEDGWRVVQLSVDGSAAGAGSSWAAEYQTYACVAVVLEKD